MSNLTADRQNPHEKWLRKLAAELQSATPPTTLCTFQTVLQAANEIARLTRQRDSFEHQVDLKNEGLREQRGEIERLRRELNNAINELTVRALND